MPIDISSIQTFSDSDLLVIYRHAIATGAFRTTLHLPDGRSMSVPSAKECFEIIVMLEQRIADAANAGSGDGGNVAVVTFNDPT